MNIYKYNELKSINIEDIKLSKPKIIDNKYFLKNEFEFYIQTDEVKCIQNFYKHDNKMYINIQLKNDDFINFLIEIDNIIIQILEKNFKTWWNIEKEYTSILEYLIPSVIELENNNILILQIPLKKGNININIYNDKKELINKKKTNIDNINNINLCKNIIKLNGVYLDKNRLYCSWQLIQTQIIS